jgi:hypothetical protein
MHSRSTELELSRAILVLECLASLNAVGTVPLTDSCLDTESWIYGLYVLLWSTL